MEGTQPDAGPIRRFVIGTAGHIDHGKTALVKALTGVDTDRWAEEKRRGITIDLGFAPLSLGAEMQASIVDVPGHEGFVRNMLAGATGIDVALLVIAADEGLMPQTEEHLAIVELLGVQRGIPVISKRDLVDAEWLELVRSEVHARLASSRVRWEPAVAASAVTEEGLDELRTVLRRVAHDLVERSADDLFRLPIDRVFAVAGAGTVVTGSTWSGTVGVGDVVRLLPLGREARVRSIEVHGQAADHAVPGRRTALALVGVDKDELARGDVAVTGPAWRATTVLDAAVELLPATRKPIASRSRVRVHLGTAEVLARVVQTRAIAPGALGPARLLLESPLVARGGDRFVLRSFSPVTTIGGGVVLDPFPPPRSRLRRRGLAADQAPAERLRLLAAEAGLAGVALATLAVRLGIPPSRVTAVVAEAGDGLLVLPEAIVPRHRPPWLMPSWSTRPAPARWWWREAWPIFPAGARRSTPAPVTPARSWHAASATLGGRSRPWTSWSVSFLACRSARCFRTSLGRALRNPSTPNATPPKGRSPSSAPRSKRRSASSVLPHRPSCGIASG